MKTSFLSLMTLITLVAAVGCSNHKSGETPSGTVHEIEAEEQALLSPVSSLKTLPKLRIIETENFNRASYVQAASGKTTVGYHQDVFFQAGELVILKRLNKAEKEIFGQELRCNLELLKKSSVKITKRNGKIAGTYQAEPYALSVVKQEQKNGVEAVVLKADNAFLISCQQPADLGAISLDQVQQAFGQSIEFVLP